MRISTILSITLIAIGINNSAYASLGEFTLQQAWYGSDSSGRGFARYEWWHSKGKEPLYTSVVYTELNRNTLNIYNSYNLEPFGKYARCGGLGCDLGKGQLIATLNFESQGDTDTFIVRSASGNASFLKGARCKPLGDSFKVLECISIKNPAFARMEPSIFKFVPST